MHAARFRTIVLWALMRLAPYPRLRALRWIVRPLLSGGLLLVRGGPAVHLRLSARHFDPFGAQAWLFVTGTHEPMVAEALRRTLPPAGVFVDVGANQGYTSLLAARIVGSSGTVVAVEPHAESARAIRAHAAANGFDVQVIEAAAASAAGSAELVVVADSLWNRVASVGEHSLETRRDQVLAVRLDDLDLPAPDVVKIDVEGAELDVIAGMERLLRGARPIVICEMHGKNAEFVGLMEGLGYRVVNLDGPEPVEAAGGNVHAFCEPWPPGV